MFLLTPVAIVAEGIEGMDMTDLAYAPASGTVARTHSSWTVRAWHVYLLVGLGAIVAYYQLPKAGWGQCILLTSLNATAAFVAIWATFKSRGWTRVVWLSLAFAMLLSAVGNGPYFGYPLATHRPLPFPSPVDALMLATIPFFALSLVALSRLHRGERPRGYLLDTGVVVIGGGLVLWDQMIVPTVAFPLPHFAHQVSVAYPVLDVVVFAFLAWFVLGATRRSAAHGWVVASYVAFIAGALEFSAQMGAGTYAYGGPTDALWMLSYLLVGVAAFHPTATAAPRPRVRGGRGMVPLPVRILAVVAAALVGPVMLLSGTDNAAYVGALAAAAGVLLLARVAMLGLSGRRTARVAS